MSFNVKVITLYPEMFPGHLQYSLSGKALLKNIWSLKTFQIKDFSKNNSIDDKPAGGGAGLVIQANVLSNAIDAIACHGPRFLMSPRGKKFDQKMAKEFLQYHEVLLICGHFEGVDERVIESRNLTEISIGDYILSGGEIAALVILDSVVRLLPGVMGNKNSSNEESFEEGLLEYPHYTKPKVFDGKKIPEILTSGNHRAISLWRKKQSEKLTQIRRPDLWKAFQNKENNT